MNRRISTILSMVMVIILAVVLAPLAFAAFTPVTLLHWNNGGGGSYEQITVDTEGALNGHCRSHPLDIIPLGACDFLTPTIPPTDAPTTEPTAIPTNIPTEEPTSEPTPEPTSIPEPTDDVTPTPSEEPTTEPTPIDPGPEPTNVVDPTPTDPGPISTPVDSPSSPPCDDPCGWLFTLIGPEGQVAQFASFSQNPAGGWYLPNAQSQLKCLGWIAVSAPSGRPLYATDVLRSCEGGICLEPGQ